MMTMMDDEACVHFVNKSRGRKVSIKVSIRVTHKINFKKETNTKTK